MPCKPFSFEALRIEFRTYLRDVFNSNHPKDDPYTLALLITFNNQNKNQFKSE